ncbi:NAD-dependent epimerase/dehydratase family protein [Candidatus Viridilinea mediisalina]|uniref:3-beta hydroxysteroid dehydrogenase n=1 Tax=Candidatus Viridilinea mediisalina TaxID=2024553 RepID=A0A2A6RPF7_9CHLR|nr:NAD-dependent epimerase/dehydratase family protein [Candidatus Viridilinea mediisalina]PDW04815.1 3-beta hydroxysteroid dehydrogenase [Candidatus Viridilinea mediisalina]
MLTLVTGGNGFIGRYLVEQLLARGDRVRVIGRGSYPELAALGVECFQIDLSDPAAASGLANALRGVEVVFHVAAKADIWGPFEIFYRNNVSATQRLVRAATKAGVPKLVYTSSPSVAIGEVDLDGVDESTPIPTRHLSAYAATKALAESYVLACNDIATTALRPHIVWGPRDPHIFPRLLARARRGRLVQIGAGKNLVDITYVENAAEAHILAADALSARSPLRGRAYFIGQEQPVNLWDFINEILTRSGIKPVRRSISLPTAMRVASIFEGIYLSLNLPGEPPFTRMLVNQLGRSHWFDHSAAKRDFGYSPRISIAEGLRRTL